jgi:hypothetical protein
MSMLQATFQPLKKTLSRSSADYDEACPLRPARAVRDAGGHPRRHARRSDALPTVTANGVSRP